MKASDILLNDFDYSSLSILDTEYVDSNMIINKNTTAVVDTSLSPLSLILPSDPLENDEVRIIDAKGTFDTNNLTVSSDDKIMESDNNIVFNKNGTYTVFIYINDSYGWKYNIVNVDKLDGIDLDLNGLDNNQIIKYKTNPERFVMEQVEPNTIAPILTGDTSGYEGDNVTITISNYSASNTYTVTVEDGTFVRTNDTIVWTLPEVTTTIDKDLTVTAEELGKQPNTTTYIVNVVNVIGDTAIVYTNDSQVDYPEGQTGFAYTAGEIQDSGDTDWAKAQVKTTIVNSQQFGISGSSTTSNLILTLATSGALSSGDTALTAKNVTITETTMGNVAVNYNTNTSQFEYTCTSMTPALSALPDNVYLDDNTMYITYGNETDDIEAKKFTNVSQDSSNDFIGTLSTSGAISVNDKIVVDGDEYTVNVINSEITTGNDTQYKLDLNKTPVNPTDATLINGYTELTRESLSDYEKNQTDTLFTQESEQKILPNGTRQLGTAVKLKTGESIKDTSINVWKS